MRIGRTSSRIVRLVYLVKLTGRAGRRGCRLVGPFFRELGLCYSRFYLELRGSASLFTVPLDAVTYIRCRRRSSVLFVLFGGDERLRSFGVGLGVRAVCVVGRRRGYVFRFFLGACGEVQVVFVNCGLGQGATGCVGELVLGGGSGASSW